MARTREMVELFRAIAGGDLDGATTIASHICRNEEQKGHRAAARLLRSALANGQSFSNGNVNGHNSPTNGTSMLPTALLRLAGTPLKNVVLSPTVRRKLEDVVREWIHRDRLHTRGIVPRSKLLFYGPPGCGKSLTARALGEELHIPVYMVRFDAVIGAFLGQTAIHLRQLFHFAETTPCVLLLDELDALGKRRGNPLDVGELDRIVISLMQELEHSIPKGLIVGTSNLPRHLDDALWRRFDLSVHLRAPSRDVLVTFVRQLASSNRVSLPRKVVQHASHADSFASAESIVTAEVRRQVIQKG